MNSVPAHVIIQEAKASLAQSSRPFTPCVDRSRCQPRKLPPKLRPLHKKNTLLLPLGSAKAAETLEKTLNSKSLTDSHSFWHQCIQLWTKDPNAVFSLVKEASHCNSQPSREKELFVEILEKEIYREDDLSLSLLACVLLLFLDSPITHVILSKLNDFILDSKLDHYFEKYKIASN